MNRFIYKLIKRLAAAVISLPIIFMGGCQSDDSDAIIKYDISSNPGSLDPQTADDRTSELIISSLYMGLFTVNADGSLGEGAAEDYTVSEDGLVYRFKLRQDVYWTDKNGFEAQCTAADFVYGFRRLFDPATRAPRAPEYYCIKNSELVCRGMIPDFSVLGVSAEGDFELTITLDYPNPRFPLMLAAAPSMPCNEEYFIQSQGRYGLAENATPSNGAFYLRSWNYDPYTISDNNNLILRRNEKNSAARKVYPAGLNFFIEDESDFVNDFLKGTTSCIAVTDEQRPLIKGKEFTVQEYSSITTGLVFSEKCPLFAEEDFRRALASLVDREKLSETMTDYKTAYAIVPGEVSLLNMSYREYAGEKLCAEYSTKTAAEYYDKALPQLDTGLFSGLRIILKDDAALNMVSGIAQEWQREFGFYCLIEKLDPAEYDKRLKAGDFEAAVIDLTGSVNSPGAYLECFEANSPSNVSGFSDKELKLLLRRASRTADLADSAELYIEAEKLLLDKAAFVPLYYKNEFFFLGEKCRDIVYNPFNKTVDFSQAKVK